MNGAVLYDWATGHTSDWKLEGNGEVLLGAGCELQLRTFHCGPGRRATTVWLKDLLLPEAFRLDWTFRSESADGNTMLIFNAHPVGLKDLFEDSRPDARYCDLASYGKIVAYSVGFHRGVYGRPSVLRKLGGHVPADWGQLPWGSPQNEAFERDSTLHVAREPLTAELKGKPHRFVLERNGAGIRYWVNGELLHDLKDEGQYPYFHEPLRGGRLAFRNFGGYADDHYQALTVHAL